MVAAIHGSLRSCIVRQPLQIGASRTKLGTVSAAIIGYYYDQSFLTLALTTQRPLRGILEHFRAEHGDKRIASAMPVRRYPA